MIAVLFIVFSALFTNGQSPMSWDGLTKLAQERQEAEDFAAAESIAREALQTAEREIGLEDRRLVPLLVKIATLLHSQARDAEADPIARRALSIAEESRDPLLRGVALNALGQVLVGEGDRARAEPVLRRSLALVEAAEGPDSLNAAKAANNLAALYSDTHQYAKAEEALGRVLPVYEKHLGPENPALVIAFTNMFTILSAQNRAAEGEPYLRRALALGERAFPESLKMANLQHCLASLESRRGNPEAAARLLEKVIAIQERLLGPTHPDLARSLSDYSIVLRRLHQKTDAKTAQNRANSILKSFHQ